jgi:4-carboxymuconolactone decarboxylase
MSRIDPVGLDSAPALRVVTERLAARGRVPSPLYGTLAHAPEVLQGWSQLADALRFGSSADAGLRELVILRLAQLGHAPYAWAYHRRAALAGGVSEDRVMELSRWRTSAAFDPATRAVLDYAESMARNEVTQEAFEGLAAGRSEQEIVELTVLISFYCGVVRALRALDIELDADHGGELAGYS